MTFVNLGTRNKPTCWEYGSAYSFLHSKLPKSRFEIPLFFAFGEGEANQHCHDRECIKSDVELMKQEFEAGLYEDEFFEGAIDYYIEKQKVFDSIDPNFAKLDDKALFELYKEMTIAIAEPNKAMLIGLYTLYLDDYFNQVLNEALQEEERNDRNNVASIKATLLTTREASYAQLEEDQLYDFVQPYLEQTASISLESLREYCHVPEKESQLRKIVEKFGWFHMEYHKEPATFEDYINYVWDNINQPGYKNEPPYKMREEIRHQQDSFFNDHPDAHKLKSLTHVLQRFAYILDHTKMIVIKGIYLSRPVYKEMGRRLGLGEIDFRYLVMPEVEELLEKGVKADLSLIEQRKKHRAVMMKEGKISVFGGKEAKELADRLLKNKSVEVLSEIRGIVGYPGKVQGKVIVVHSIADRDKFKRGDILVTHDGSAELTVFLKEAGAIVTDEGGMICHATIIAREMKTPCIVGTQSATRVFKDGDMVEVNSDTGTVQKLSD